jgi:pyrimidine-nucleoside phosphorylase
VANAFRTVGGGFDVISVVDLIERKRDGDELSRDEIGVLVREYTAGAIPDYQMAAWLMAVCIRGMSPHETADLTMAMAASGQQLDLSGVGVPCVDKHSTGGVGDTTSLIVVPIVAAAGVPVAKMSGRGLGFSGGTLDKLESIPGFDIQVSPEQFVERLRTVRGVIAGQSADLAPADGKLYALRDVTGTVPSIPLIASSVMSKKLAGGAPIIVLDVKCGRGAFMHTADAARQLAFAMIEIGWLAGRKVTAFVSDMDEPLGSRIGNALEIREAVDVLTGRGGSERLRDLAVAISAEMIGLAMPAIVDASRRARDLLESGAAFEALKAIVASHGGDTRVLEDSTRLPSAVHRRVVPSTGPGWVRDVDPRVLATVANQLGAGRQRKGDQIDPAVGLEVHAPVGTPLRAGSPLATLHASSMDGLDEYAERVRSAFTISEDPVARRAVVLDRLSTRTEAR